MVKKQIEQMVEMYAKIGFPSLLHRFVLRNGKEFENVLMEREYNRKGLVRGRAKECYSNATNIALYRKEFTYVEGFAIREDLGLLIDHAWVIDKKGNVIDTTWNDPEDCHYMGVPIPYDELLSHITQKRYYGMFSNGVMINIDYLLKTDPGLKEFLPMQSKG